MEIRQLIVGLRVMVVVAIAMIGVLTGFAFINYGSLENSLAGQAPGSTMQNEMATPVQNAAEQLPGFGLFKEWGCNTCHAIDRKVVGPALGNIRERRSDEWLQKFIRNSSAVIASGDDYAVTLYNEYSQLQMPSHDLSDEDIVSILDYITEASKGP
jgi:cytochrome c551/c552